MIISVISIGGLCNRMRTMAGVIKLAKEWNTTVFFVWVTQPDMNSSFVSLFDSFPYKVVELKGRRSLARFIDFCMRHFPGIVIDDEFVYSHMKGADRGKIFLDSIKGKNILVCTCENITDSKDFSCFTPTKQIRELLDKRIGINTIGVHIRRTDNENSKLYSPTELFIEKMQSEVNLNKDTQFYLATDDIEEENLICETFPDRVLVYKKRTLDRNNPCGIIDAMVDLLNLSHCHHILGSYYSSFSEVAAEIGNINRFEVKKEVG